jgi:small subunit ribosomal protein S21
LLSDIRGPRLTTIPVNGLKVLGGAQALSRLRVRHGDDSAGAPHLDGRRADEIPTDEIPTKENSITGNNMVEVTIAESDKLDWALKTFKKKMLRSGILKDLRKKRFYVKPSEARQRKSAEARRRRRSDNRQER